MCDKVYEYDGADTMLPPPSKVLDPPQCESTSDAYTVEHLGENTGGALEIGWWGNFPTLCGKNALHQTI